MKINKTFQINKDIYFCNKNISKKKITTVQRCLLKGQLITSEKIFIQNPCSKVFFKISNVKHRQFHNHEFLNA